MTEKFTAELVDDDPGVFKALSRLLRAKGHDVKSYSSPQVFLEEHDLAVPGGAVLDDSMPGLDGLEIQRVLTVASGYHRPVVFVTGKGDIPTAESRRDRLPDQARKGQGFVRSRIPCGSQGHRVSPVSFRDGIGAGEGQQPDTARTRSVYACGGGTAQQAGSKRPSRSTAAG